MNLTKKIFLISALSLLAQPCTNANSWRDWFSLEAIKEKVQQNKTFCAIAAFVFGTGAACVVAYKTINKPVTPEEKPTSARLNPQDIAQLQATQDETPKVVPTPVIPTPVVPNSQDTARLKATAAAQTNPDVEPSLQQTQKTPESPKEEPLKIVSTSPAELSAYDAHEAFYAAIEKTAQIVRSCLQKKLEMRYK